MKGGDKMKVLNMFIDMFSQLSLLETINAVMLMMFFCSMIILFIFCYVITAYAIAYKLVLKEMYVDVTGEEVMDNLITMDKSKKNRKRRNKKRR